MLNDPYFSLLPKTPKNIIENLGVFYDVGTGGHDAAGDDEGGGYGGGDSSSTGNTAADEMNRGSTGLSNVSADLSNDQTEDNSLGAVDAAIGSFGLERSINTNIAPAEETKFNAQMEVESVTTWGYAAELNAWAGHKETTSIFSTDTLTISPLNHKNPTVEFGTIAAHAYSMGLTATEAIAVETSAKIGMGVLLSGFSVLGVISMLSTLNKAMAGLGLETAEINDTVNLGLQIASITAMSIQLSSLAALTHNPTFGIAAVGIAGFSFSELGASTSSLSVDTVMSGESDKFDELRSAYIDISGLYVNSVLGKSIDYNNKVFLGQIKKQAPILYTYQEQQGDGKMQMIYKDYKGGLSEILAPHLIQPNEGQIFTNINTDRGIMKSERAGIPKDVTYRYKTILDSSHIFVSNNEYSIAKIGNFFYITLAGRSKIGRLNLTSPVITENDILDIDMLAPTSKPTCSNSTDTSISYTATASLVNIKGAGGTEETYTATITSDVTADIISSLVNNTALAISGTCSAGTPDGRTILVMVEGKEFRTTSKEEKFSISVSDLSYLNAQFDRELWDEYKYAYTYYNEESGYESIPIFSDSWLRKSININVSNIMMPNDDSVDKIRIYRIGGYSTVYRRIKELDNTKTDTTITFTDNVSDVLTYSILDTDNISDILDLTGLIEHKGSLLAFKNNQVYFSKPGKPNVWSEFQSVRVGGLVKSIASVPLGILIITDNQRSYILGGTDKTNYTLATINNTVGIVSNKSLSYVQNSALWLGYEGIMTTVGSAIQNLSRNQVDLSDIGEITCSFSYDKIYYLCGENYMLTVDFNSMKPAFKKVGLQSVTDIFIDNGKICYIVDGKEYSDFGKAGEQLDMHYRSPEFVAASYDILKEFDKVNITFKGSFTYNIWIDNSIALTGNLQSDKYRVEEIQIPSALNEGLSISLELIGTGEVVNFRYLFSYLNNN